MGRLLSLILVVTLVGTAVASAAMLMVDGGVLQVFAEEVDLAPIPATIKISPQSLNASSSNGEASVTVQVGFSSGLPDNCGPGGVNSAVMTVKGQDEPSITSVAHPNNPNSWMIKFSREEVLSLLVGRPDGDVTLVVQGVINNCLFAGEDTINYKNTGSGQQGNSAQALLPEPANDSANVQNEPETVEGDGSVIEPVTTEPPVDGAQDVAVETPVGEPQTVEPPQDESGSTKQEDPADEPTTSEPVGQDTGPGRTAPPANVTETTPEDDAVTTPEKVVPPVEEPEKVGQEEQGSDPPIDEPQKDERDVPVKEPIGEDPPADEVGDVPIKEPIDETEIPVIVPSPDRPQDQDNDEKPAAGPDESGQDTAPVVAGPPSRNPPPGSGNEQPQDVVGEQPPQGSAACPIDAEARIMPEVFDVAGLDAETSVLVRLPGGQALGDVPLVTMRVKLGPDQYGQFKVEGKPDALLPVPGVFEFTQEQMLKVLEDRRGEVTLEVRGVLDGCEFVGTDKLTVIETVVEPPEPVTDETVNSEQPVNTEPVQDETQKTVNEPEQTTEAEPPADTTESEDQTQTSENAQTQPTESSEQDTPQAVEEEAPVESESVEGPEQAAKPELDEGEPQISEGME